MPLQALSNIRHSEDVEDGCDAAADAHNEQRSVEQGDDGDEQDEFPHHLQHPDQQVEPECHQVSLTTTFALHVCNS